MHRTFQSLGHSLRGSPSFHQWLCNLLFLPYFSMASQPNTSSMGGTQEAGPPTPEISKKPPRRIPKFKALLEVFEISLLPLCPTKRLHHCQSRPGPSIRSASENLNSFLLHGCLSPHPTLQSYGQISTDAEILSIPKPGRYDCSINTFK